MNRREAERELKTNGFELTQSKPGHDIFSHESGTSISLSKNGKAESNPHMVDQIRSAVRKAKRWEDENRQDTDDGFKNRPRLVPALPEAFKPVVNPTDIVPSAPDVAADASPSPAATGTRRRWPEELHQALTEVMRQFPVQGTAEQARQAKHDAREMMALTLADHPMFRDASDEAVKDAVSNWVGVNAPEYKFYVKGEKPPTKQEVGPAFDRHSLVAMGARSLIADQKSSVGKTYEPPPPPPKRVEAQGVNVITLMSKNGSKVTREITDEQAIFYLTQIFGIGG